MIRSIILTLLLALLSKSTSAADWSHWFGPNGNKTIAEDAAFDPDLNNWKIAWQTDIGLGYSTVTTAHGKAYSIGHDGKNSEIAYCFDALTGEKIWEHAYEAKLLPLMHVGGPNASITIDNDLAYIVSKDGQIYCLDAKNGKEVWTNQLTEVMGIEVPNWGFASSPVPYQDNILVSAGEVAALNKKTGKPAWTTSQKHHPGYGTPVVFRSGDEDRIAAFDSEGLSILDAADGTEISRHPVKARYKMTAATPYVLNQGESIFLSVNPESRLLSFSENELSTKWSNRDLQNFTSGNLIIGDTVFGFDGHLKKVKTHFYAMDLESGKEYWAKKDFGFGSLIAIGETLLILTEQGELVTAKANSDSYQEISRVPLLEGSCLTDPVYSYGRIYIRNELGKVICLERSRL